MREKSIMRREIEELTSRKLLIIPSLETCKRYIMLRKKLR